ncbi:hypothetical protein BGZ70_001600 [Mortierella alpina]|uniref:Amine oxidase domain-containing protein n=1 Tax=Mortierella alpina TaxID=64518 RepID=A0A9P6IVZ8_MORAP|nr:hypothetical protein BGZ70_001600 [Mortierella alpina]
MRSFFPEYYPNLVRLYRSLGIKIHDADNTLACFDVAVPAADASSQSSRDYPSKPAVQEPYLSSRSYKVGSGHTITLPDLPPFSIFNPVPFGRRVLAYYRIAKDYIRILIVSKEFMSKGRMMDVGKHPIEWGNGRYITLREFLEAGGYSHDFAAFFVPLFACVCTCSFERVMEYPACVVLEYVARCMPFGRMQFVSSGVQEVTEKLSRNLDTIHYNTTIEHIAEVDKTMDDSHADIKGGVVAIDSHGVRRTFDHVIFATQANQAAATLAGYKARSLPRPYIATQGSDSDELSDGSKEGSYHTDPETDSELMSDVVEGLISPSHPYYHQIKTLLKVPYERTQVVCHTDTSFLPKNPAHWRLLNIAKATNADILASPLKRLSQELEQEMMMRSRKARAPRSTIFSVKPASSLRPKSVHRKSSQNRLKAQFAPSNTSSTASLATPSTASQSHNSAMATHIMNRTIRKLGETTKFLQTTNPIFPPRPETVIASAWFERAVVNPQSVKAVDELQLQMEQQTARWISRNGQHSSDDQDQRQSHSQSQNPVPTSDRVWFVGSYAYPGIPLLEGCVVSAVQLMERIVAAEPALQLAASASASADSFLKRDEPMRNRRRERREATVTGGSASTQQQENGKAGQATRPTPSAVYFRTAWKDALEDGRRWDERQQPSGTVWTRWVSNVYAELGWMLCMYALAIVKWWVVLAIESFGGDSRHWALT